MGRKKKKPMKPWCWYCNREFEDDKVLISHQKARHFKCNTCNKKLYTGPGLVIHCIQVHKETIEKIPNSLPNRHNIEYEIYGMDGIPENDRIEHEKSKSAKSNNQIIDEDSMPSVPPPSSAALPPPPPTVAPPFPPFPGFPPGLPPALPPSVPISGALPPPPIPNQPPPPLPITPFQGALPRPGGPPFMGALPPPPSAQSQFPPVLSSISRLAPPGISGDSVASQSENSTLHPLKEVPKIVQPGPNVKIVHPEDDISLEELRARLPKYAHLNLDLTGKRSLPPPPPPTLQAPATNNSSVPAVGPPSLPPGIPPMPHFLPGMPPPPGMFRPPMPFGGAGLPPPTGLPPPHLMMQPPPPGQPPMIPPPMFGQVPPGFPPPGGPPPPHFLRPPPPNPNLPPHLQPHFRL